MTLQEGLSKSGNASSVEKIEINTAQLKTVAVQYLETAKLQEKVDYDKVALSMGQYTPGSTVLPDFCINSLAIFFSKSQAMKTTTSLHIEKVCDQLGSRVTSKKGKNLYVLFLEAMIRKASF